MESEAPHPARPGICDRCGAAHCARQGVISRVLGGKESRLCLGCLSLSLGSKPEHLCELVGSYLSRRDCYRREWLTAQPCENDGAAPCCPSRLELRADPPCWYDPELFALPDEEQPPEPDLSVDAEESGCGDLMVLLMRSVRKIAPGQVLELIARDPGAEADIPSWCRLTGHTLLAGPVGPERASYFLRRKPS